MKLDHVTERILQVSFTWISRIITGVLLEREIGTQEIKYSRKEEERLGEL